ncbi:MAG: 30S ribosomal protein S18 [Terriglobia bacterium]
MTEQQPQGQQGAPRPPQGRSGGARAGGRPPGGRGGDRGRGRRGAGGARRGGRRFFRRRKVCRFCVEKADHVDYKDVKAIGQFVGDRGKILPRRSTGVCSPHQRQLRIAIKRARNIALLPFGAGR